MIAMQTLAACLLLAANTYHVPPAVMIGIMHVEAGHVGQEVGPNSNGTYDLGPMQVNSRWLPELAQYWHVNKTTARAWVRDNGCVNVHVAAWILHQKINEAGYLYGGIARYHSATPGHGQRYASKVVAAMERQGLIKHDEPKGSLQRVAQKIVSEKLTIGLLKSGDFCATKIEEHSCALRFEHLIKLHGLYLREGVGYVAFLWFCC